MITKYSEIESFMLQKTKDSAHDKCHIYRVLNSALEIAEHEGPIDDAVLITACLLHDIGREKQRGNPEICHAEAGGQLAYEYLLSQNWDRRQALHVKECVSSHRFRGDNPPGSIEAKILFDADKLDVCGALGIARTLIYAGQISEPLYHLDENGAIVEAGGDVEPSSFFQEYCFKLQNIYSLFYTDRGRAMAESRRAAAVHFYNSLYAEVSQSHGRGQLILRDSENSIINI